MKNEKDLIRALNITNDTRAGKYYVDIPGYYRFTFERCGWYLNKETGKYDNYHIYVTNKLYTWGGQDVCEVLYEICATDFADDLTDEQIRERFIELMEERYPSAVIHTPTGLKVKDVVAMYPDLCLVEQGYKESYAGTELPEELFSLIDFRLRDFPSAKVKAQYDQILMNMEVKGYQVLKKPVKDRDLNYLADWQKPYRKNEYPGTLHIYLKGVSRWKW